MQCLIGWSSPESFSEVREGPRQRAPGGTDFVLGSGYYEERAMEGSSDPDTHRYVRLKNRWCREEWEWHRVRAEGGTVALDSP